MAPLAFRSLRSRLLAVTLLASGITLVAAWFILSDLFRAHAQQQFVAQIRAELDQVTAQLDADEQGRPVLDATRLSDPRWTRPRSGRYWQIDGTGAQAVSGLLRSRSLWDAQLQLPPDAATAGELQVRAVAGPNAEPLLALARTVRVEGAQMPWRVVVAANRAPLDEAVHGFDLVLAWSLLVLLALLGAGALLQVTLGLAPLRKLRGALAALREGRTQRLGGAYPDEVQPLVDDLNALLTRNAEVVARARAQAGNLAHALKTPLTVLAQAAQTTPASGVSPLLVDEQVTLARRHIDWHLARSRAAAAQGVVGMRTAVHAIVEGLVRVLHKLYAARNLTITVDVADTVCFAGETQDLQEMLGNLLDNACKAARTRVHVGAADEHHRLRVWVDDDGPGIPAPRIDEALRRGGRLDETTPGSGLGLAIVEELASLYGGALALERSTWGGLRATLVLPAAPGR
ncbi:MAG: ATP-binding protein [Burkholderiales bacterium]|nr:ATP-binding protein [Burkholderiales bacterium]